MFNLEQQENIVHITWRGESLFQGYPQDLRSLQKLLDQYNAEHPVEDKPQAEDNGGQDG